MNENSEGNKISYIYPLKQPFMLLLRTLFISVLFLFSALLHAADQGKLDSLNALLEEDIPDSTRLRLLIDVAEEIGVTDTLLSFSYLQLTLRTQGDLDDITRCSERFRPVAVNTIRQFYSTIVPWPVSPKQMIS